MNSINYQLQESIRIKETILSNHLFIQLIDETAQTIIKCYQSSQKLLIAGNGGSAADAQHIAGEFVSRFYFDRPALSAIALTTDTSILTAIGNDYGFERLFQRQVEALGAAGDIFWGISTSGDSENIINAMKTAKEKGLITIGFTGARGGKMKEFSDFSIEVPSIETPRIQEIHITLGHIICSIVEQKLFGSYKTSI